MSAPSSLVIYHAKNPGGCLDGFGAAYAAWTKLKATACYLPVDHGHRVTDLAPLDITIEHVYVLDFAWPLPETLALLTACQASGRKFTLLDHHQTAALDLGRVTCTEGDLIRIDQSKSGAVLAWEYFHPAGEPLPRLLAHVQDRDLWQWKLEGSRELTNWLYFQPRDFLTWNWYCKAMEMPGCSQHAAIWSEARAMRRQTDAQVQQIVSLATPRAVLSTMVPTVNCPAFLASDVGEALAIQFPLAPFTASYYDRGDERVWGLRSPGRTDCATLASRVQGGGGHPGAAGFQSSLDDVVTTFDGDLRPLSLA